MSVTLASASASEIFAGSIQDWDKGLVMGKPTFGKGSVQQLFPLANGNGIKITNAYYYIKSGRCIHKLSNDKLLKGEEVSESEQEAEAGRRSEGTEVADLVGAHTRDVIGPGVNRHISAALR